MLFDYVIKEDISESVYNAKTASATASAADEYEETKRVEMNLDSFGLATTPDENKPTSPKGWTKTSLTKDTDTEQLQSGVIYSTDYKAHSGESCLIIPYLNTAGTAWFTVFSGSSFQKALSLTVVPFIAGDIAKIVLCTVVTLSARERLKKAVKF